jgi:hypothetical protein
MFNLFPGKVSGKISGYSMDVDVTNVDYPATANGLPGLGVDMHWTQLALDIVEPGVKPILISGARVLQQKFFQHEVPWIAVTLIEMPD